MADTDSPKVARAEQDLSPMLFKCEPDHTQLSRTWTCPADHTIAAYADCMLNRYRRAWVEFHLSGCQRCRVLVADVVKAQRESDLPMPPRAAMQRARGLQERRPVSWRWVWAPAGALAGIALLAIVTAVLRNPQQLAVVSPPVPPAPLVGKSEPAPVLHTEVGDTVRKPRAAELLPTLLFPQAGGVMNSERLQFRWKPIPQSRNYQVRLVRSDGDPVWEGQTDKSALQLPSDVTVKDGAYFVWITAYLDDGRTAKSAPVYFLIQQ
jgi:hypothetical protein